MVSESTRNEENRLNCPYCNKPMERGEIPQDRYALKWKPDNPSGIHLSKKDIMLSNLYENKKCIAYLCEDCMKIVIDLKK